MSEPVIAHKALPPVDVEAGGSCFRCACGRAASQPICDGAHKAL